MGPLASAQFMVRLTLLTPATHDQEHIPTVLWSDPRVPDRTVGALAGGHQHAVEGVEDALGREIGEGRSRMGGGIRA